MSDLRPNQKLLNSTFNGYKLSTNAVDVQSLPLVCAVNGVTRKNDQYSYAYIRSQEMHNHLYRDDFSENVFFTDTNLSVNALKKSDNGNISVYEVFKVPQLNGEHDSSFSDSMVFPSDRLAVISDGNGFIYIVNTGIREESVEQQWHLLTEKEIYDLKSPSFVLTANIESNILHVVTLSIKELKDKEVTTTTVVLNWLQIYVSLDNQSECAVKGVKTFIGKSIPSCHWFNEDYTYLVIAAEHPFYLVNSDTFEKVVPFIPLEVGENVDRKFYRWHQSKDLVSISFDFHVTDSEIECELTHNSICAKLSNGKTLLHGSLEKEIITDASRWFVEKNRLEVILVKKSSGDFWSTVVQDDKNGVHDILGEEEDRINEVHEGLSHLTSDGEVLNSPTDTHAFNMEQLEECDEDMESEVKLYSLDVFTGKVETLKNLVGHQWLFVRQTHPCEAPLICLRHDVDGVLWKPSRDMQQDWKHSLTFDALGYVQASKQEHKFTTCSNTFKHAFITDCTANVYIYERDNGSNKKERNQYVASFKNCEKIFGCQAIENNFYVLTDKHINIVKLP